MLAQPDQPAIRLADDPLAGLLLAVGGGTPAVFRVLGAHGALRYDYAEVEGERLPERGLWPDTVPPSLHGYRSVVLVPTSAFAPVDVLRIAYGSRARTGGAGFDFYLWQAARLDRLTEAEARRALASAWVYRWRYGAATERAYRLR